MKWCVLLSGGLDSAVCLAKMLQEHDRGDVLALSFYYGQRQNRELGMAEELCAHYGVRQSIVNVEEIMRFCDSPMLSKNIGKARPRMKPLTHEIFYVPEESFLPFRNGSLISIAATVVGSLFPNEDCTIVCGFCKSSITGDTAVDCTKSFSDACNRFLEVGSAGGIHLFAPFAEKRKADVVKEGIRLGVPFETTWSCYEGGDVPCGTCRACLDRRQALRENQIEEMPLR